MKILYKNIILLLLALMCSCAEKPVMQWDMKKLHDTYCPDGADQQACTVVDLNYPEFYGHLADSLNALILNTLCLNLANEAACQSIDIIADDFIQEYKVFQLELPGNYAGWQLQQNIDILHETSQVLAMKHEFYVYTGGAHGMPGEYFINIDKNTGHVLSLDDIVKDGKRTGLVAFAKTQFYEQRNIPAAESLYDAGYWFDNQDFYLPDNFSVSSAGLLFLYNPYEIASYAEGMIELSISYSDAKSLLKMERLK